MHPLIKKWGNVITLIKIARNREKVNYIMTKKKKNSLHLLTADNDNYDQLGFHFHLKKHIIQTEYSILMKHFLRTFQCQFNSSLTKLNIHLFKQVSFKISTFR